MKLFETENDFTTSLRKALTDIDPDWETYNGIIIPGSHHPSEIEEKLAAIRVARANKIPLLAICLGHQLVAIEYVRNVLGVEDATSEEFGKGTFVVKKRKELNVGEVNGQSWWNQYEVVVPFITPPHFVTSQFHPEYSSNKANPHPLLVKFLNLCANS